MRLCGRGWPRNTAQSGQLQLLRRCFKQKHRHGNGTRVRKPKVLLSLYAPCFSQISNGDEIAKGFAPCTPILGVRLCAQDEGCLLRRKAPTALISRRGRGGSQGESLGVFSFAISLRRGKEMASIPHSAARSCTRVKRNGCGKFSYTLISP